MPIVDVLVPTYNRSSMLRQCLESVRNQVFQDFRVTIGDDCSSDTTPDVVREFCSLDSRFRYMRNTLNLGQWGNVNALVGGATAPYLHILHDDDWIEPGFYAQLVPVLEASASVGMVFSRSLVSQVGSEYPPMLPIDWPNETSLPRERAFRWMLGGNSLPMDAALIRTSVLRNLGSLPDEFQSADWLLWLELSVGHDVAMVDAPLAHYRIHGAQVSTDTFCMYKDILKMLTFARGLPLLEGHAAELSETRFSMFRSYILTLKESTYARRDILDLTSLFVQLDGDRHRETRRVVGLALAYAALPSRFKHGVMGKSTGFRRVAKRLLGFDRSQEANV